MFIDASANHVMPATGGVVGIGPNAVVSFVDPSSGSLDHFWMVPQDRDRRGAACDGSHPVSRAATRKSRCRLPVRGAVWSLTKRLCTVVAAGA